MYERELMLFIVNAPENAERIPVRASHFAIACYNIGGEISFTRTSKLPNSCARLGWKQAESQSARRKVLILLRADPMGVARRKYPKIQGNFSIFGYAVDVNKMPVGNVF
jgi:hypothetical protein